MKLANPIMSRHEISLEDTWDLTSLLASDEAWESAFQAWESQIHQYDTFRGKLGEHPAALAACLQFDSKMDREAERLGTYAFLKTTEDQGNSDYQRMLGRYQNAASRAGQAASFIRPEVLALPEEIFLQFRESSELQPYRRILIQWWRFKPHTLTDREEKLLAMQAEMAQVSAHAFRQLLDADLKFGRVKNDQGLEVELTNSNFIEMLYASNRDVRRQAFHKYYEQFSGHQHTLAATLHGTVHRDVYYAQARGHASALESSLFPDNVPVSVYENLISAVRKNLPSLHNYYAVRQRAMQLPEIHHYDTYVPILADVKKHHTWEQASRVVLDSLAPLGSEYVSVLERGLFGRWCDRYPNRGKQSGAFSCGTFDGDPYILMNFSPDVLGDVFTLTHEAGHSMHSYYSAKAQSYENYNYTIFVAEVASTFNEQLLLQHLLGQAGSKKERAYLLNRAIDDMRGTIFRQTMFAEFEKVIHELAESGEPLTVKVLRHEYRKLLSLYFGPAFCIDEELELECLRIPHFYNAFYVYKYATGMSAAIALSQRVLEQRETALVDYLNFLRGGCSLDPLDLLRNAGVDMERPEPIDQALQRFETLVQELDEVL
ncbi:MAG: oligoendopeptidase F [Planctomycetota bacterium]|nr:oligoendopeptidase F [Planctomycetota bacterium]MDA1178357.1 oligoendopeptidase F [Planctomycetota bacterium]